MRIVPNCSARRERLPQSICSLYEATAIRSQDPSRRCRPVRSKPSIQAEHHPHAEYPPRHRGHARSPRMTDEFTTARRSLVSPIRYGSSHPRHPISSKSARIETTINPAIALAAIRITSSAGVNTPQPLAAGVWYWPSGLVINQPCQCSLSRAAATGSIAERITTGIRNKASGRYSKENRSHPIARFLSRTTTFVINTETAGNSIETYPSPIHLLRYPPVTPIRRLSATESAYTIAMNTRRARLASAGCSSLRRADDHFEISCFTNGCGLGACLLR